MSNLERVSQSRAAIRIPVHLGAIIVRLRCPVILFLFIESISRLQPKLCPIKHHACTVRAPFALHVCLAEQWWQRAGPCGRVRPPST